MLCEGVDRFLSDKTSNYLYETPGVSDFKLLLKNYKLSDDIAFRFSNKEWKDHPLTSEKFAHWVHGHAGDAECINLFMDYETFGEHQWRETGIFEFLNHLPEKIFTHPDFDFKTPSEVIENFPVRDIYDVPYTTSWADAERDLSAWNENKMQKFSLHKIYSLEKTVKKIANKELIDTWAKLTTSDHFYYMSTKFWSDGDVHKYFSPYDSPYDAHIFFMNVLSDFEKTLEGTLKKSKIKSKARPPLIHGQHRFPEHVVQITDFEFSKPETKKKKPKGEKKIKLKKELS